MLDIDPVPMSKMNLSPLPGLDQETGRGLAATRGRHPGSAGGNPDLFLSERFGTRIIDITIGGFAGGCFDDTSGRLGFGDKLDVFAGIRSAKEVSRQQHCSGKADQARAAHQGIFSAFPFPFKTVVRNAGRITDLSVPIYANPDKLCEAV